MRAAVSDGPVHPDSPLLAISRLSHNVDEVPDIRHTMFKAHGIFLTIAFCVMMPIASAIIRGQVESAFTKHSGLQMFTIPTVIFGISIALFFSTWNLSVRRAVFAKCCQSAVFRICKLANVFSVISVRLSRSS